MHLRFHINLKKRDENFSNGGYVTSPKIGRYCGNRIQPIIKSDSNILMVKFRSDNSRSAPGFEIFWDGTTIGKANSIPIFEDLLEFDLI